MVISISDEPWGVWQSVVGGFYSGSLGDYWSLDFSDEMMHGNIGYANMISKYGFTGTWVDNKIKGDVLGAWIDLDEIMPKVGISAGDIVGTFDPSDTSEMTWQAYATGLWIRAEQVLEMASTSAGRAMLEELNIPAIEIGRTTLTGSISGVISVNMSDVTFFATSNGASPRIWATDNISGTYTSEPLNANVYLYGDGLSADFNIKKWDSGVWGADISYGYGTIDRTDTPGVTVDIEFDGVAGGNFTGTTSGSFSGTGAGLVREGVAE